MNNFERARRYIAKMPPAISGAGGHNATFAVVCALVHGFGLDAGEALPILAEWNQSHAEPPWRESDLRHKLESALSKPPPSGKPRGYLIGDNAGDRKAAHHAPPLRTAPPDWPERGYDEIRRVIAGGFLLVDLWELSPIRPEGLEAEYVIDFLFPGNPWLCVGADQRRAETARRESLRGTLAGLQFIVPSPMTGPEGKTQTGRKSPRCLDNTGPRRFLVIEFDFEAEQKGKPTPDAPLLEELAAQGATVADLCASLLLRLGEIAPLCLAVHSGGKSLHGWFPCHDRPETSLRSFMRYAVHLGADRATWTRCQFVRMPGGLRANGARQEILFFSPDSI